MLLPNGLAVNDMIIAGESAEAKVGNCIAIGKYSTWVYGA